MNIPVNIIEIFNKIMNIEILKALPTPRASPSRCLYLIPPRHIMNYLQGNDLLCYGQLETKAEIIFQTRVHKMNR